MPYSRRIKTLEESYRLVNEQIDIVQHTANPDPAKLQNLIDARNKYLVELREMRRAQYEANQEVDFGDDR